MFIGTYNHTLDEKGRLIIPSKFREELGSEFVITKGLDGCLFAYNNTEWKAFEDKLRALPVTSKDARNFQRYMLGGAGNVEIDKQGRVLIPANLRDHAKLDKDVVLLGVGTRIEIWDQATHEGNCPDDVDSIVENMSVLGI